MSEELAIQPIVPRNPGWFQPGNVVNPGGRGKDAKILSDLLRKKLNKGKANEIIDGLISLALNAKEASVRLKAAELCFDRTEGKAMQAIQVSQTLDESTARRLVEIGAMLQNMLPQRFVSELTHLTVAAESAVKTCFPSDITSAEKTSGKRKYVRSGKYAKVNKLVNSSAVKEADISTPSSTETA